MRASRGKLGIPLSKAILAALWYEKANYLKEICAHPYVNLLNRHKTSVRTALFRLRKAGLIKNENKKIALTESGQQRALFCFVDAEANLFKSNFFQKWDGAWRILLFDIPENKRRLRDYLRIILKRIGFKELQRSIWIYPYPVPQFLKEIVFHSDISAHARLITTDSIENDADLKEVFNL